MNLIVFEDIGAENLFPVTTGRPCYAITCASFRLIDWLRRLEMNSIGVVRPYLEAIQEKEHPWLVEKLDERREWTLVVNARLSPTLANFRSLQAIQEEANAVDCQAIVARVGWAIAAAMVPTASLMAAGNSTELIGRIEDYCNGALDAIQMTSLPFSMLDYPHDIVRDNLEHFSSNLEERIRQGEYREIQPDVFCSGQVELADHVVMDTTSGPIVIEEGASVGPFTLLEGPVFVGRNCRIIEHAAIKDCVSLGSTTKIGGEVEASVIESYTNKQHHGFLGHSYLGSWINLGAGTCNSDLKNTYGKVNMEYRGKKVATDMRFVGCFIGDYAKTAINTSIFTGKTIGACSMVYGFVTTNVPSFVNYARSFGQTTELPPAVMQSTQQRMFARRNVDQHPCDRQLINDMYTATAAERQLSEEPLIL